MKIRPKEFTFKKIPGLNLPSGSHVGFLAQDLQELLPNLVSQSGLPLPNKIATSDSISTETRFEKYLTLNYTELIPHIVKSIQEQQLVIEKQNSLIKSILVKDSISSTTNLTLAKVPHIVKLYPNPTQSQFDIECFTNGQPATIYIYNKEGKAINSFTISDASSSISLESFENGVYIVALFVNGTCFDTKRFIVSK